ncbi:MAG: glyoxal reductase [Epulopiscium sp. Nele67-Bin002]|nr:MAG: glyoxal reductase [Epulopiscium sp. Nuni2H_MBin001]OON92433.1 MAG: glyoxal reductase [Epulopiscium sp. Nele67-Bin002]OON93532.1 MAG: glyoxal reductase [Epulopiscium sp. Nele67-Bin001]
MKLNTGKEMPDIGLGVFRTQQGDETVNAVKAALKIGYRQIDTAMIYRNEKEVGDGIRQSGVAREDIFLTTKLWTDDVRAKNTTAAYQTSIDNLGVEQVDLYLIHWAAEGYQEAWADMEKLYEDKKVGAIGVSNFQIHHLKELEKTAKYTPAVNQIESHPYHSNQELIDYCQSKGIVVTAYSPLGGQPKDGFLEDLKDETIVELANKYGKSAAQIVLRWHLQRGIVIIPKSKSENRIAENFAVFDFELSADDMASISALNKNQRMGADPDNLPF